MYMFWQNKFCQIVVRHKPYQSIYTVAPKIDRTAHTIFVHHCFFVNEPALRETVFIIVSAMVSCLFD